MSGQRSEATTHLPTITYLFVITTLLQLALVNSVPPLPLFACDPSNPSTKSYPFCNTKLPINQRVKDLVSRLSLDEKIAQLTNSVPPIPRLGIPVYEWWSESLHGVSRHGRGYRFNGTFARNGTIFNGTATIKAATMFPQIILTASSFDAQLWYRIARAIATEARAMFNVGQGKGLTFWAPNINIFRDPRWGRGQETPGEDPLLTSIYGVSYVRGLQGYTFQGDKISKHLQASACCKHFAAHDLDNWHGITRYTFNAEVSKQDLADTFQPPFQSCVEQGQASSIMCAYNRVNGIPSCAHHDFLTDTARGQWHFDGYIVSDCNAVPIIYEQQKYAKTPEDAVAAVLSAGMDVECGSYTPRYSKSAIIQKKVAEEEIDQALNNLFSVRMRLGLFDGDPRIDGSFGKIGPEQVCSEEHQNLALEAAQNSIVLLKNDNNLLPLPKAKTNSFAVIGPNANSPEVLLGNYEGFPCKTTTILEALQSYVENIKYHSGCNAVECSSAEVEQAVELAKEVDYVVMVMDLDQTQEREKLDRVDLVLPGKQQSLIASVAEAAKTPIVLVLLCGGPVDISLTRDDTKVGSILWAGYPGESGGLALAEIIFGDHNPGGRLPVTWYPQDFVQVPMTDMRMRPDKSSGYPGRTYRFYQGKKVYEFGYGLSYSNYSYKFTTVTRDRINLNQEPHTNQFLKSSNITWPILVSQLGVQFCETLKFSAFVRVKNTGKMAGRHPVLLFVRTSEQNDDSPIKQLTGFERVNLNGGQESEIEFSVSPCKHLSKANKDGQMAMDKGVYFLVVGEATYKITTIA
ncbi:probable beta-D-xylosidase 7 [Chenopodium quinoa]|uniref:Fibronectin type III-like domain-containing protein n=1 Tax=Chenopodium quinoa TaxID=63459 RepID=A0A803MTQ5_CHEQI|nr:probable beta-D-xylosidase 7 [Chenopodium quinoa]